MHAAQQYACTVRTAQSWHCGSRYSSPCMPTHGMQRCMRPLHSAHGMQDCRSIYMAACSACTSASNGTCVPLQDMSDHSPARGPEGAMTAAPSRWHVPSSPMPPMGPHSAILHNSPHQWILDSQGLTKASCYICCRSCIDSEACRSLSSSTLARIRSTQYTIYFCRCNDCHSGCLLAHAQLQILLHTTDAGDPHDMLQTSGLCGSSHMHNLTGTNINPNCR